MSFLLNPFIYAAAPPAFSNVYSMNFNWTSTSANVEYLVVNNQSNVIDTALRDSTPNFSVSGWFKVNDSYAGQVRVIFGKYDSLAGKDRCFQIYLQGANRLAVYGQYNNAAGVAVSQNTASTFTSANGWVHFVYVYDSSGTIGADISKIYINGSLATLNANTVSTTNKYFFNQTTEADRAKVGTAIYAGGSGLVPELGFGGELDELTFWDKSLSASEVTEIYNSGYGYDLTIMTDYSSNCLAWWRMGDASGDNWDGSNWNIVNAKGTADTDLVSVNLVEADRISEVPPCTYVSTSNLVSHWPMNGDSVDAVGGLDGTDTNVTYPSSPSVFSKSLELTGSASYVNMGNSSSLQSTAFSVGAWVYISTIDTYQYIIDNYGKTALGPYRIMVSNSNRKLLFSIGVYDLFTASNIYTANTWHHVVLTKTNTSTAKYYVDGVEYNFGTNTTKTSTNSKFTIGSRWDQGTLGYNSGDNFDGNVEDAFYFSRALTAAEVSNIYAGGATGCRVSNP